MVRKSNQEKWCNKILKIMRKLLTIAVIAMFLASCAGSKVYNVGTGKPMSKGCGKNNWYGGQ